MPVVGPPALPPTQVLVAAHQPQPEAAAQLKKFKTRYKTVDIAGISCATGDGLEKLKKELLKRVTRFRSAEKASRADSAA